MPFYTFPIGYINFFVDSPPITTISSSLSPFFSNISYCTTSFSEIKTYKHCCYLVTRSRLTLCHPMDIACQAPLSMGCSRQEYWSGLPFLPPGDLPDPRIEPTSPALAGGFFTSEPSENLTSISAGNIIKY